MPWPTAVPQIHGAGPLNLLLPLFEVRSPRLSMARCLFSLCCFSDVTFSLAFLLKSQVSFFSHFLVPLPCPVGILTLSPLVYCLALPRESKLPGRGSLFSSLLIFVSQGCYNQVPKPGWLKTIGIYCLTVSGLGVCKGGCHRVDSSQGLWWEAVPGLTRVSGGLSPSWACKMAFFLPVTVSKFPFFIRAPVLLD